MQFLLHLIGDITISFMRSEQSYFFMLLQMAKSLLSACREWPQMASENVSRCTMQSHTLHQICIRVQLICHVSFLLNKRLIHLRTLTCAYNHQYGYLIILALFYWALYQFCHSYTIDPFWNTLLHRIISLYLQNVSHHPSSKFVRCWIGQFHMRYFAVCCNNHFLT